MNIFFTDDHPQNITIFSDVLVEELDKNHSSFYDIDKCILSQIKDYDTTPHVGNIYTTEIYKRFYSSLLDKIPSMANYPIEWRIDGIRSKFFINNIEITTKTQLLDIIRNEQVKHIHN